MGVTFREVPAPSAATHLIKRLQRLQASLEWAGEALEPGVRKRVSELVELSQARIEHGWNYTIVAIAGGTGSGKSALFNALTNADFAKSGVERPTTAQVTAAHWGAAAEILDWLVIPADRRLARDDSDHAGLILLDLPDHDSVDRHNHDTAHTYVAHADAIIWVVDPQKYADHALHAELLTAGAKARRQVVVLNHRDRLSGTEVELVKADLQRLFEIQGISEVPVFATSATSGVGVADLVEYLQKNLLTPDTAVAALRANLLAAGQELSNALARGADPHLPDEEALVRAMADAFGVPMVAELSASVVLGKPMPLPAWSANQAVIKQLRSQWLDAAATELPHHWRLVLDEAIASAGQIQHHMLQALKVSPWPEPPQLQVKWRWARRAAARSFAKRYRELALTVLAAVLEVDVFSPTRTIHEAYRAMDELSELPL